MTDDGYRVEQSAALMAELRRLSEVARAEGRLTLFTRALDWAVGELERTPMQFGESADRLNVLGLWMRRGFSGPLFVGYGVHQEGRRVFLRRVRWGRHPLR